MHEHNRRHKLAALTPNHHRTFHRFGSAITASIAVKRENLENIRQLDALRMTVSVRLPEIWDYETMEKTEMPLGGIGQFVVVGIAIVAIYAFLQDFMSPDWPAWILSPLLLIGFRGAIAATPDGSIARAALWQAALFVVPFTGIYGLLDVVFSSDGPVWLLTPLIVGALWLLFSQVVDLEAD